MKKSVEILGLPIISITEGRELGTSKTLLIDAKNRLVAAITIEDDDWYRGVKLIPYESVIAIGEDAVTITHSQDILSLEEAGDYERFLDENIRVIGTKAITRNGRIQGKVTEIFVGEGGKIVKCEITTPEGAIDEVDADQISIFGKQVTVVDINMEKKNGLTNSASPAFEPVPEIYRGQPAQATWTPPVNDEPATYSEPVEEIPSTPEIPEQQPETFDTTTPEELPTDFMTPEPEDVAPDEAFTPFTQEPPVEETPSIEVEETPVEMPSLTQIPVVNEMPTDFNEQPDDNDRLGTLTKQAEELKKALKDAQENQAKPIEVVTPEPEPEPIPEPTPLPGTRKSRPIDERRRKILLGKHATKTIVAGNGMVVIEAGEEITEEVLQRAQLANKIVELSMNVNVL